MQLIIDALKDLAAWPEILPQFVGYNQSPR